MNLEKSSIFLLTGLTLLVVTQNPVFASDKEGKEASLEKRLPPSISRPINYSRGLGFGKEYCWEMVLGQKCLTKAIN